MPWTDALDNELRAVAVAKGWDKLDDAGAAQAVFRSYVNLERVRPEPAPVTADGYDFAGVRNPDGSQPEKDVIDLARGMAFEMKLPPSQAKQLAAGLIKIGADEEQSAAAQAATALKDGEGRLNVAWGANVETNKAVADKAFAALGWDKDTVNAMTSTLGIDKLYQVGHALGSKMGEASLLTGNDNSNAGGNMTRDQAIAERNRLMNDVDFGKKIIAGDHEAMTKLNKLGEQIVGTPDNWSSPPANFGRTIENPTGPTGEAPKAA